MMTKQIKSLMLAGTVGLAASLTGCGDSSSDSQVNKRERSESAQVRSETANDADAVLKELADEIKKVDEGIKKAADDLGKIKKKTSEKIKAEPKNTLGLEISSIVGSDAEDRLTYLTELKAGPERMRNNLEIVKKELKKHSTNNKSQISTDTGWDSLYYLGATLLLALFVGLGAGWGAGTLAAKRKLTKAGFW